MVKNIQPQNTKHLKTIPYRMAFAGGWIDQPFISMHNPTPPGSMVVVSIEPTVDFLDRCGMGTSTRKIASEIWGNQLPDKDPTVIMHELYSLENQGKTAPSGSQDMAGIIYPGINRLDYDYSFEGGYFPAHIETNTDPEVARWLEEIIYVIPINQRPIGYDPLTEKNLHPEWIQRLGQTGKACFDAIVKKDAAALGASMNECMVCWQNILPNTVQHPLIDINLLEILSSYQQQNFGAMYSGCGGGYLYIVSDRPISNSLKVKIRLK
ncbi:MAG: hypothetical protein C0410_02070 [Anaerolinea sp.]|nr:hypothetical protein [Anaerolinea sp.]